MVENEISWDVQLIWTRYGGKDLVLKIVSIKLVEFPNPHASKRVPLDMSHEEASTFAIVL